MILTIVAFGIGLIVGFIWGAHDGTTDTERRWADAVGRAADQAHTVMVVMMNCERCGKPMGRGHAKWVPTNQWLCVHCKAALATGGVS